MVTLRGAGSCTIGCTRGPRSTKARPHHPAKVGECGARTRQRRKVEGGRGARLAYAVRKDSARDQMHCEPPPRAHPRVGLPQAQPPNGMLANATVCASRVGGRGRSMRACWGGGGVKRGFVPFGSAPEAQRPGIRPPAIHLFVGPEFVNSVGCCPCCELSPAPDSNAFGERGRDDRRFHCRYISLVG